MGFNVTTAKSIFQSVTFWGAVLTAVALAFPTISAKLGLSSANTAVIAQYIVQGIGIIVTIYGRFTAKQLVTWTGGAVPPAPGSTGLTGSKG